MPKLFVANTSKQHQVFMFRLHEQQNAQPQTIPIGQQRQIGGDLTPSQIEDIVRHHERYGLRKASEISRRREFVGLCYSIDDPVPLESFYTTYETNDAALDRRSEQQREETALAISHGIQETLRQPVQRTEVETVEQTDGTPKIAEGIEVVGEGTVPRHEGRKSRLANKGD